MTHIPIEIRLRREIRHSLCEAGLSRVVVAVSGGADSVALLSLLHEAGADIIAAHCNFHLRGEESDRDAASVSALCHRLEVPLETIDFDVPAYIRENRGKSVEMACRELRYDWFFSLMKKYGASRVAVAHNADDNAETLLLNLMRGSGTAGLKGMLPDNGKVWRPLLGIYRREIEEYLAAKSLPYVTDSTNLSSDYRRNFLRNDVIPLLKSRWEGFDKALMRTLSQLRGENRIVEKAIADALPEDKIPLSRQTVISFPDPELLVRRYIDPLSPFSTTASEIVEAMRADKPDIKRWKVKGGEIQLRNGKLFLQK